MVGWHHRLNGHDFEQAPGVGDGQGGLVGCSPPGHKESDTIEQLNNNLGTRDPKETPGRLQRSSPSGVRQCFHSRASHLPMALLSSFHSPLPFLPELNVLDG